LADFNAADQAYNVQLKATVDEYREKWPDANLFYFDYYGATYEVLKNAEKYGA
jgi:phospholipase/lecithinase/hemolysin